MRQGSNRYVASIEPLPITQVALMSVVITAKPRFCQMSSAPPPPSPGNWVWYYRQTAAGGILDFPSAGRAWMRLLSLMKL